MFRSHAAIPSSRPSLLGKVCPNLFVCVYIYIYVKCVYAHMCTYVYIYIYITRMFSPLLVVVIGSWGQGGGCVEDLPGSYPVASSSQT